MHRSKVTAARSRVPGPPAPCSTTDQTTNTTMSTAPDGPHSSSGVVRVGQVRGWLFSAGPVPRGPEIVRSAASRETKVCRSRRCATAHECSRHAEPCVTPLPSIASHGPRPPNPRAWHSTCLQDYRWRVPCRPYVRLSSSKRRRERCLAS